MRLLPAYYLFPILMFLPLAFTQTCRVVFLSTSKLRIVDQTWKIAPILFFQACELCFIGCVHFWCHQKWSRRLKLPTLPINLFFLTPMVLAVLCSIFDFENVRYNLQTVSFSTLKAYVLRPPSSYARPLYQITSKHLSTESAGKAAKMVIADSPVLWGSLFAFMGSFLALCLYLCHRFRGLFFYAVYICDKGTANDETIKAEDTEGIMEKVEPEGSVCLATRFRRMSNLEWTLSDIQWVPKDQVRNPLFITFHVLGLIHLLALGIFIFYPFEKRLYWQSIRPFSYNFLIALTHYESSLTKNHADTLLENVRSFLPKGRYWLDTRDNPVYPAVHGDLAAFCGYNPSAEQCKTFVPTPSPTPLATLPNVVVLLYESFNPVTYLVSDEFINEHASVGEDDPRFLITNTTFWNRDLMPHLSELSKQSITFSGLSSNGIPTFSGWHTLITGATPSQTFMNIIDGHPAHIDDLPSFLRNEDYRTFFLSAQDFGFDGMRNWVWRRSAREEAMTRLKCREGYGDMIDDPIQLAMTGLPKMVNCSTPGMQKKIEKLTRQYAYLERPKWFDYLAAYCPGRKQARLLGLNYNSMLHHEWIADRVTDAQFKLHWKQQREYLNRTNQSKPLFGMYLGMESHMPYTGYDKDEFYSPRFDTIHGSPQMKKEMRFKRVNHYADHYFIGETIKYLKENDPNTIVILTGDHATRDIPIRGKNSPVTDTVIYSEDCVGGSSGPDSMFGVSGMISYLGDDPAVKKALGLDKLAGMTVKIPADHNDITYTIMETVSQLRGHSMPPTNRRSRNLVELATRLLDDIKEKGNEEALRPIGESGWQSLSVISLQLEYRNGTQLLRTHTSDISGSHYYRTMSLPACLKTHDAPPHATGGKNASAMTDDAYKYLAHENFLFKSNKLFHYDFRNQACISERKCEFPERTPYRIDDSLFYIYYIGMSILAFLVGLLIAGIVYIHDYFWLRASLLQLHIPNEQEDIGLDIRASI